MPLKVIGLNNVPCAGDEFEVVSSLDTARVKAESRAETIRDERISAKAGDGKVTLSSFASAVSRSHSGLDLHQLVIIMKVDLQVRSSLWYYLIPKIKIISYDHMTGILFAKVSKFKNIISVSLVTPRICGEYSLVVMTDDKWIELR